MGGPVCLEGTAYTAGGLVAQTSAINLKVKMPEQYLIHFCPISQHWVII